MQTIPTFVYLIPTLILFGLGVVPGLISTVIFAIPAPIRLTYLGIVSAPQNLVEAGESFGATKSQLLWKVELPHALPTIMAGLTQRSEEHTSELQSLMRISYAVFCLKKKNNINTVHQHLTT